jgi:hypothetical protein
MCHSIVTKVEVSGGTAVTFTCKTSGKPINQTSEYGMFCEDFCDLEECKKEYHQLKSLLSGFLASEGLE